MLKLMLVNEEGETIIITEAAEDFDLDNPIAKIALIQEVKDAIEDLS